MYILTIGDSKTLGSPDNIPYAFRPELLAGLNAEPRVIDAQLLGSYHVDGGTAASISAGFAAYAATLHEAEKSPAWVLVNVGTNDTPAAQNDVGQAAWETNYGALLDAIHAEWPSAQVLCARVLVTTYTTGQNRIDDTWLPNVLSTRGAFAAVGIDERDFLPGHLADYTHPDPSGYTLTAAAWQTAMGY